MTKREIVKGASGYFLANLFNKGLSFVFVILATRILGAEGYGLIALGVTVYGLVNNFGMFGMKFSSQKSLSGEFDNRKSYLLGSMFTLNLFIAIIFSVIFIFANEFIANNIFNKPQFGLVLRIIGVSILFSLPCNLVKSVFKAQKKVKLFFYTNLVLGASKVISLLIVFILPNKLLAVSLAILFSSLISFILSLFFMFKEKIIPTFKKINYYLPKVVRTGFEFLIVGLGYYLAGQSDKLMLGALSTSEALGNYAVAASIASILGILHGSMVSIFMPTASELYKKGDIEEIENKYYFVNMIVALLNVLVFIGFVVLGDLLINLLFDLEGKVIYYIFCLLSFRFLLGTLVGPTGALLNMTNKHKMEFINTVLKIVLNIILNYFLIKAYGVYGAVFATLFTTFIINTLQIIEIFNNFGFKVLKSGHVSLVSSLIIVIGIYFSFDIQNVLIKFGYLCFSQLFVLLIFWIFLNDIQKKKILKILKNFNIKEWRKYF